MGDSSTLGKNINRWFLRTTWNEENVDLRLRINDQWRVLSCTLMDQVHQRRRDQSDRKIEEPRKKASRSSGRNLNPGSQEYTAGMLTARLQSSVRRVRDNLLKIFSHRSLIYIASVNLAQISYLCNK